MSEKPKAPCGHDGEPVIGAYVRCSIGCSQDPFKTPKVNTPKRGQPGHVDFCACKPCTIRRRGVAVVMRTKDGKEQRVPWDGIAKVLRWTAEHTGKIRHWQIVDEDGGVMLDGMCDVPATKGDGMRIDLEVAMPAKLVIVKDAVSFDTETYYFKDLRDVEGYSLKSVSEQILGKSWRQAAKPYNFGGFQSCGFIPFTPARDVWAMIREEALKVPGVTAIEILNFVHGETTVMITESSCTSEKDEAALVQQVHDKLSPLLPGFELKVVLNTPMKKMRDATEFIAHEFGVGFEIDNVSTSRAVWKALTAMGLNVIAVYVDRWGPGVQVTAKYLTSEDKEQLLHRYFS